MEMLTADQVAERLGVKLETVYAYASRGALTSHRGAVDGRSGFEPGQVEQLARRGRPRRSSRPPALDFTVHTNLTLIDDHRITYRGHDALDLATAATFEQVAELLWRGELPADPPSWDTAALALPRLADLNELSDRIRLAVVLARDADPMRADLRPEVTVPTARSLIVAVVGSLAQAQGQAQAQAQAQAKAKAKAHTVPRLRLPGRGTPVDGTIAGRLWSALAPHRPRSGIVRALNSALVLLADHELASSTLAARVAASTRADPYSVVLAGSGPLAGPLHGGASRAVRRMLDQAAGPGGPSGALAEAVRSHESCPGFGHPLYPNGDPRASVLLGAIRSAAGNARAMSVVDAVLHAARSSAPLEPNIDFALAALGHVAGMPTESGEIIFTVARMSGWLAHAFEEYEEPPLRFRARAVQRR